MGSSAASIEDSTMWILVRLALTISLGCIIARECGFEVSVPGDGNPFIETAFFVLIAVAIGEMIDIVRDWRNHPK